VLLAGGLWVTVLAGRTVPLPLPPDVAERIRRVTVTESDAERSAFSVVFDAGRSGPTGAQDMPFGPTSRFVPFTRVVIVLTFGAVPQVLFDGIVTETSLQPGSAPGESTFTVTGDDIGNLLDREEKDVEHPALDDLPLVLTILASYAVHGIVPRAFPPAVMDPPLPIDRVPTQHGTDLAHLTTLAERHGFVTYSIPGPAPGVSSIYWGPPVRVGAPQPSLAVDLLGDTNVLDVSFRADATRPTTVSGSVQDRRTNRATPVMAAMSTRPPLGAVPLTVAHAGDIRRERLRDGSSSTVQAMGRAQAAVDRSADAVTGQGRLDGARYGGILRPRGLVGLRGAGTSHDGLWYVQQVEHDVVRGSYTQAFTITRDGLGTTLPAVPRAAS
jgi:hypothetical protein